MDYLQYKALCHHGIKGQKWGVRNAEWYPIDEWKASLKNKGSHDTIKGKEDHRNKNHKTMLKSPGSNYAMAAFQAATIPLGNFLGLAYAPMYISRGLDIAKQNKEFAVRDLQRADDSVDPKTGLRLKKKKGTESDDMAAINPGYPKTGTTANCMLCTTAYDLRRRGFDVEAQVANYGYMEDDLKLWYPKAKPTEVRHLSATNDAKITTLQKQYMSSKDASEKARLLKEANKLADKSINSIVHELEKQGNGARGNLMVAFKWGGRHSVVYEVKNGKVVIRDCQDNSTLSGPEVNEWMKNQLAYTETVYTRLDNIDITTDKEILKELVR